MNMTVGQGCYVFNKTVSAVYLDGLMLINIEIHNCFEHSFRCLSG
jgi:hypothetical protein